MPKKKNVMPASPFSHLRVTVQSSQSKVTFKELKFIEKPLGNQ